MTNLNKYFVIEQGSDCDGVWTRGRVQGFISIEEAGEEADRLSERSDGMSYCITSNLNTVSDYCDEHSLNFVEVIQRRDEK